MGDVLMYTSGTVYLVASEPVDGRADIVSLMDGKPFTNWLLPDFAANIGKIAKIVTTR